MQLGAARMSKSSRFGRPRLAAAWWRARAAPCCACGGTAAGGLARPPIACGSFGALPACLLGSCLLSLCSSMTLHALVCIPCLRPPPPCATPADRPARFSVCTSSHSLCLVPLFLLFRLAIPDVRTWVVQQAAMQRWRTRATIHIDITVCRRERWAPAVESLNPNSTRVLFDARSL